MIYLFDTNAITDLMNAHPNIVSQVRLRQNNHILALCQPVDYEIRRGLLWRVAPVKYQLYLNQIKPQFEWIALTDADWGQASQFWANTRSSGKQLVDVDLLLAALGTRLDAVIVSNDDDFDALSVKRENWRKVI